MALTRSEIVQGLLSLFPEPQYLEIGVNQGATFLEVTAGHKVAVDPKFSFDYAAHTDDKSEYHEVTSDEYFGSIIKPGQRFDVIYLDGLHTSEQTLRDFMNATMFLKDDGIILIDDVCPRTHIESLADRQTFRKVRKFIGSERRSWMGDVYRLIYFIETFAQQFSYKIIADNHGQAVCWKNVRRTTPHRTIAEVGSRNFEDFVVDQATFKRHAFSDILQELRQNSRGRKQGEHAT